jgi:hypothetical protein
MTFLPQGIPGHDAAEEPWGVYTNAVGVRPKSGKTGANAIRQLGMLPLALAVSCCGVTKRQDYSFSRSIPALSTTCRQRATSDRT